MGLCLFFFFFFQAEDGIRDWSVTGVQTCALPISVMGTNTIDRIARISDAMKVTIDRPTWFRLYEAALGREVA